MHPTRLGGIERQSFSVREAESKITFFRFDLTPTLHGLPVSCFPNFQNPRVLLKHQKLLFGMQAIISTQTGDARSFLRKLLWMASDRRRGNNFFHNFISRKNAQKAQKRKHFCAFCDFLRPSQDYFRAHALVREDFEHNGMRHAAIHERDFFDPGFDRGHSTVHFRNHTLVHNAGGFQAGDFAGF